MKTVIVTTTVLSLIYAGIGYLLLCFIFASWSIADFDTVTKVIVSFGWIVFTVITFTELKKSYELGK